jgi:Sec-independent protein translocase protein TatA
MIGLGDTELLVIRLVALLLFAHRLPHTIYGPIGGIRKFMSAAKRPNSPRQQAGEHS